MFTKYLVTGATGFLGGTVVRRLVKLGAAVRALVMPGDRLEKTLPAGVERVVGRVDDESSLAPFFKGAGEGDCVIHCAGIVSIASDPGQALRRVNVGGTENIISLCIKSGITKLVYVSSVHAIPEKAGGEEITEVGTFSPKAVSGFYAQTKAEATAAVLAAAVNGLDASVVHPSGIIGPGDSGRGNITGLICSYIAGKLPVAVRGGYDFVDVRDVADGIISCTEKGKRGECYILSNRRATVREILETVRHLTRGRRILMYVPLRVAAAAAPLIEKIGVSMKKPPAFTPYAIETLGTGVSFSHEKAARELGFRPRPIARTVADTVGWLYRTGAVAEPTV